MVSALLPPSLTRSIHVTLHGKIQRNRQKLVKCEEEEEEREEKGEEEQHEEEEEEEEEEEKEEEEEEDKWKEE
ncbi:hypothetical protein E2C01_005184 [Portunus trituberculatus]|uniref:Uncharacterized protein n=1 Tax=Portunus trituberculatus TaxID=210409 RepID=A0A5B7CTC1_PORTR|nr:hypothetical protein [Portunus trituberculatus]